MGKQFENITSAHQEFISKQKIFFVATAMGSGYINLSPKGMDALRVLGPNEVLWLNLTGSGNETAAHLKHDKRMTIMFCAFEGKPLILRLYGEALVYHSEDIFWKKHIDLFPDIPGKRQLIHLKVDMVQNSCGMGVPLMDYKEERQLLDTWAKGKGETGLKEYWQLKNTASLDGLPTDITKET